MKNLTGPVRDKRKAVNILRVNDESGGIVYGYAEDLSRSGMFISCLRPKKIGEEFTVSFELPFNHRRAVYRCRVTRVRDKSADGRHDSGMGVRFLDMDDETSRRIDAWVDGGRII